MGGNFPFSVFEKILLAISHKWQIYKLPQLYTYAQNWLLSGSCLLLSWWYSNSHHSIQVFPYRSILFWPQPFNQWHTDTYFCLNCHKTKQNLNGKYFSFLFFLMQPTENDAYQSNEGVDPQGVWQHSTSPPRPFWMFGAHSLFSEFTSMTAAPAGSSTHGELWAHELVGVESGQSLCYHT